MFTIRNFAIATLATYMALIPDYAQAQAALVQPQYRYVLPPIEYDHPYDGDVWVLRANAEQMRRMCPPPKIPGNLIMGCAKLRDAACYIVVGEDAILKKGGMTYKLTLRHETGHCLGWSNNHGGARMATESDW